MRTFPALAACAAFAMLGACEARIGNDAPPVAENATAAGRAEDGRLTIEAPGFNMSIDIPEGLRSHAEFDGDDELIYPGSRFGGIHVQGGRERGGGEHDGEVELRFTTEDAIERVAAWYRDPARRAHFRIASENREGDGFVLVGTDRTDNDRFTLRLTPRDRGTEARLLFVDRN